MPVLNRFVRMSILSGSLVAVASFGFASRNTGHGWMHGGQGITAVVAAEQAGDEGNADKKDGPEHKLKRFMRQKLEASNSILEGLCTEDLPMVAAGAEILMKMSHEEQWRVSNDMMYRRYSNEFGNAVEELQKEAEDQDMDGTSMAWVNVTMKCLKCHEWVRNTVLAESAR
jgi:hypothetical protein